MDEIVQLRAADFEEAMEFLKLVFGEHGPHDMERLIPSIYRRTNQHMACNYAVKRNGEIVAIVGLFPITLQVGDRVLRVAGIGGVSTHPKCRGQGLMKQLMNHCLDVMRVEGFHLSYLGGQRQRYRYFGYEVCGNALAFTVSPANIRHCYTDDPAVIFRPLDEEDFESVQKAKTLHDAQPIRCDRPLEDFFRYCVCWKFRPWAAFDRSDELVGYLIADDAGTVVPELVGGSAELSIRMVRAWVERSCIGKNLRIKRSPVPDALFRELAANSERMEVCPSRNWQIFKWNEVVEALLQTKLQSTSLPDGSVSIAIDGWGVIELRVDGENARCRRSDKATDPDLVCDPTTALRILFGPLAPSQIASLPRQARVLEAWCPLPLMLPNQDCV